MMRDDYAVGPFTRIRFVYFEGRIQLAVPLFHPDGVKGDLVYTIVGEHQVSRYR